MNDDDLTDGLRSLATGVRPPADAVDQIQRGVRARRRRRTSLVAAAAVLAVVGGGTAGAQLLAATGPDRGSPAPAGQPSVTTSEPAPEPEPEPEPSVVWVQQIPADFALDDGMPEPDGVESSRSTSRKLATPWALDPCQEGGAPGGRSAYRDVTQQALEQLTGRQLALYADAATAQGVVDGFRDALARCPNPQLGGGGSLSFVELGEDYDVGDDSFAVTEQYSQDGLPTTGATDYAVVRVGNAVLVAQYSGEFGAGPPEYMTDIVTEHRDQITSIADRMCVFAEEPCS